LLPGVEYEKNGEQKVFLWSLERGNRRKVKRVRNQSWMLEGVAKGRR
jgi:hypothetical protein